MLRDFKFMRRNSGKTNLEEAENLPVNPNCSSNPQISSDLSRPALITIQDPCQTSKCVSEQEMSGIKSNRFDRTPTKPNPRLVSLKTPEKSKNRFGWAQKSENHGGVELKDSTPARSIRGVSRANSECNLTQNTPTKSVSKGMSSGLCLASGARPPVSHSGSNRMVSFAAMSKGNPSSCNSPAVVNSVEVPYFALKEDSSFWMDHNVQVLIRVRPLNSMERSSFGFSRCLKQESSQCLTWIGQPETRFTFDHVACEAIEQETLFRMVGLPMVENCLSGYNSCMFAYGQTGSGKTFTMLGEIDGLEVNPSPNRGMTPRIFEFLFARIREEEECRRDEQLKYTCKCSFLEIYNEQITDLLDPSATNLMLREDMKKGVYVENLSEFEVHTVGDILHLLSEGSSNRRVASTNMNRESSRSHSVFTCVIESSWEKDSTTNFRFARLNLVDLAGSERQKSSGAEGERLKEAANINRSLSTLGHVIMVLVDVAHGKTKHIPYRDSRLTFLLQDSLGGNSKTIIIANVSPSICSAAETLNTLKFAQRAKMIQNNAIINEDSSGDVSALRLQIRLLKEELSTLKHDKVNRSLSFGHDIHGDIRNKDEDDCNEQMRVNESHGVLRVSCKQLKSLETTLAGAFRREQMAETSIKQLEAEIEHLNRLVSQREEDTRCTKMMLKFREDKIQRMESVIGCSISADVYLMEENAALSEEIKLLRAKIDKNPEVTRFALENIRLLEQVQRFQDLYEEGERDILMGEITELRNQLIFFVDANSKHSNHLDVKGSVTANHASDVDNLTHEELKRTIFELEESKAKLASCLDDNEKLRRELEELHASSTIAFALEHDCSTEVIKESIVEVPSSNNEPIVSTHRDKEEKRHDDLIKYVEEVTNLQLELDILKIILQEERSDQAESEKKSKAMIVSATKEYEKVHEELKQAKLVIEALESQQMLSINEIDDLRNSNVQYEELLNKKEHEISSIMKPKTRDLPLSRYSDKEESRLEAKLKKMHESLEKAKIMNQCYRSGILGRDFNEEDTEEVRKQVEAETAEVIVCLQEELSILQQEVNDSKIKEVETEGSLKFLQTEMKILEDHLRLKTEENEKLAEVVRKRENELKIFLEEREVIGDEIEGILSGGAESLKEAQEQIDIITISFPDKASRVMERFGQMKKYVAEKEMAVEKLHRCLEDAMETRNELENMLRSLRGASLLISETHQQESTEKEKEIFLLSSKLDQLERKIKNSEDCLGMASSCATAALVIVNRFSEIITQNDAAFSNHAKIIDEGREKAHSLHMDLEASEDCCSKLMMQLLDEQKCSEALRVKLEETENDKIVETKEKLKELNCGVSKLKFCMDGYLMEGGDCQNDAASENSFSLSSHECESRTGTRTEENLKPVNSSNLEDVKTLTTSKCVTSVNKISREATIVLLRKEIESALESFHEVQAQMAKLQSEKEDILTSEKHSRKSLESLMNQTVLVQASMNSFESEFQLKFFALDDKLVKMEEFVQETCMSWLEQRELLEAELDDAKVFASQKSIEASCILEKFGEVQDTMKEADIMINELMIANEVLKHNACQSKERESNLIGERDTLVNEIEALKFSNNQKDQNYLKLEKQYEKELEITKNKLAEIEQVFSEISTSSIEEWMSLSSDFQSIKSHFHESTEFIKSLIEELWSEIVVKDSAVSVLHLCHMGILLETANGLNAENGLLQSGLCKSNASISALREHNAKSQCELEICRNLSGKLLTDIKNGLDRVSSKVDEDGEFTLQLKYFEKKIEDLHFLEEMMLEKSNEIGSELAVLMRELDRGNRQAMVSLIEQEMLLKDKDELFNKREESLLIEILVKDFEVVVLSSELMEMSSTCIDLTEGLENFKKVVIFKSIDISSSELILKEEFKMEETALYLNTQKLNDDIRRLEKELSLQMNLMKKDEELGKMKCIEEENKTLKGQFEEHKKEYCVLLQELEGAKGNISVLEVCIAKLEEDLNQSRGKMEKYQLSQTVENDLCSRVRELETQLENVNSVKNENISLRNELNAHKISQSEYLTALSLQKSNSIDLAKNVEAISSKVINLINERFVEIDDMFQQTVKEVEKTHLILDQFNKLENIASQLDSEAVSVQMELSRKDDIVKGLLFDLSMLQESASNSKDQKDETEKLKDSLMSLERDFELKSANLDKAMAENHVLLAKISTLELEIVREQEMICSLSSENCEILSNAKDSLEARNSMEKELKDTRIKCENLEMEITERENALARMSETIDSLKSNLEIVTLQADNLDSEVFVLAKELESTRALAEEHEAIAVEAQEIAELRKVHAEEKEEEVRLLERSIEELECTINVLEQKVDFVKGEAERQRLEREELEMELLSVKEQMQNVESNDSDLKRLLDENEKKLQDALQRVELLEREIAAREDEVSRCKAHISELNFHAEAQACEYKQKFKSLEAMVEQVKSEVPTIPSTYSSPSKLERKSSKPRGSGSPFKCIGLGLAQQVKSERDEELTAGKQRIEELEALASSRQKEILMLKARLASTESMTHDVIRDLLGVKLNMSSYATLMDSQQLQTITDKTQHHNAEVEVKDQEVANLKLQINEFIKEKNGWLEEIERKQAEVMAAHVALEKLHQQDQFLSAENGMLKMENSNYKKRVTELETEVKKLSGHQNIQQRIHHHAKIKDENNLLRHQNEDLSTKLRKTEAILSRVKEELAQFRAANGKNLYIDFDEEERLDKKLKEAEEERLQLAGKLLSLCTTVLKAAGIRRPTSEINLYVAEEALHQLKNRVVSLEMELQDAKLKNRISDERNRMLELRPQASSSSSSRADENCQTRNRLSPSSFRSTFDR